MRVGQARGSGMLRRIVWPGLILVGLLGGLVLFFGWTVRSKQEWPWLARVPIVASRLRQAEMAALGFRSPQEQSLFRRPLATLESHGMRLHVLGARFNPMRLDLVYQIEGEGDVDRYGDIDFKIEAKKGYGHHTEPLTETTWLGRVGAHRLWILDASDQIDLQVGVRFFDQEQTVTLKADRRDSASYYHESTTELSESHEGVTLRLTRVVTTPDRLFLGVTAQMAEPISESLPYGYRPINPWLETPEGRLDGVAETSSMGDLKWFEFARPPGEATLYFDRHPVTRHTELRWPLQLDASQRVDGALVRLTELERSGDRLSVVWALPHDAKLLSLSKPVLIGADGSRAGPGTEPGQVEEYRSGEDMYGNRSFGFAVHLPDGFEPVAVESSGAAFMAEGPWRIQLPPLNDR